MKKIKAYVFVCFFGIIAASCTDHVTPTPLPSTDRQFVVTASDQLKYMFTVSAATGNKSVDSVLNYSNAVTAYTIPETQTVWNFGDRFQVPISNSLSAAMQARYDITRNIVGGVEYDTTYINLSILTLKEMITLYNDQATNGQDTILISYAKHNIKPLESLLKRAQVIDSLQRL